MDSFFTFLLRNYFSDIDLDPGFRQIEATESGLIGAEVLHDFLEEKYAEKDPAFLRCAEYFCPGADDGPLEELILELSKRAGSHPSPEAWLKERAFDYDVPDEQTLFSTVWMRSTVLRLADFLIETGSRYDAMLDLCREPGGPDVCYAFLKEEQQGVVRDVCCRQADFLHDNADMINMVLSGYAINGVSMSFGTSWNVVTENGVAISRSNYEHLQQTGLCCRLL